MLGQCSWRHRFRVCSSRGNSNRKSSFWRLVGICVFPCRTGTSRSCLPSEACKPITSRCGVGSSGMPQKWNDVCALGLRPTNDSWRVDETYIRVKGNWVYLYRAVDSSGATIDLAHNCSQNQAFEGVCYKHLSRNSIARPPTCWRSRLTLKRMTQFIKWCSLSLALHSAEVWLDKRAGVPQRGGARSKIHGKALVGPPGALVQASSARKVEAPPPRSL